MAGKSTKTVSERFETKYRPVTESGCWLWIGSGNLSGYGQINIEGRPVHAHRVSWALARGPIPDGMHVLHKCDTRTCVNPDHLFLGTNLDNVADRQAKRRTRTGLGVRNANAKVNPESVAAIRQSTAPIAAIAAAYGVGERAVWQIRSRRTWKHVA